MCFTAEEERRDNTLHWILIALTLNDEKERYDTTQSKCLAIIWSELLLRSYLKGTQFTIRTDHDPLKWILILTDSTSRLERWRFLVSECHFDVVRRAGIKHQAAEASSRLRTTGKNKTHLDNDLHVLAIDEQKNGEQTIHLINASGNEEITLRGPDEQPLDASTREEELLLEQKLDKNCRTAVIHAGQLNMEFFSLTTEYY